MIPESGSQSLTPSFELLTLVLGHPNRWRILAALVHGDGRELREVAESIGEPNGNTAAHLRVLQRAGFIEQGRGKLYRIPARFLPEPGKPVFDCGACLLRLDRLPDE